jgi:phosphate transport system permease protein
MGLPLRERIPCISREWIIKLVLAACAGLSVLSTLALVLVLSFETFSFFLEVSVWEFLTDTQWTPLFAEKHYGILPLFSGTLLVTMIALLAAVPVGLVISVYLSEYAPPWLRRAVKPVFEVLAGIPTVVYGYFALLFVTPHLQEFIPGLSLFNALSPGLVLGLMVLPLITSLSQDALLAVPDSLREAAYALGSSKLQTSFRVVVPAASSGIIASCILAFSRAIGETMIVTIAGGQLARIGLNPLEPVQTMTAYIVQVSLGDVPAGSFEYRTVFAVGAALFVLTLVLNMLSQELRRRFREVYQ